MKRASIVLLQSLVIGPLMLVFACGTKDDPALTAPAVKDAGADRGRLSEPFRPTGRPCEVVIDTPELLESPHVPEGTAVTYSSSPPSSGPHYPVWANFQEFTTPIDDGYLVHSLEHGAVALLYNTAQPDVTLAELRKIRDAIPTDPVCDADIRVRVIIAPYPKMDVPIAAVAWGWTYRARCVDTPTLLPFAKDHIAQGTENICAAGRTSF